MDFCTSLLPLLCALSFWVKNSFSTSSRALFPILGMCPSWGCFCPLDAILGSAGCPHIPCIPGGLSPASDTPVPYPTATMTLDPNTAHPDLILSEDCKSVRRGGGRRDLPDNPERFDYWPFVLGCQGFMAGRHFWEVEVGDGGDWAVGVARESICRKGHLSLCPQGGIWGVEKWGGQVRALTTHKVTLLPLRWVPRRVSIHLDYGGGTVAFFDADEGRLMFIFSHASFTGERVHPWLWVVGARSQLRLCP
uniref:B30.2/SPRY domain-containing protein n=1 Tax=Falco tinnunculus TaxID=100819 RepID=A0A8C4UZ97_FALTI